MRINYYQPTLVGQFFLLAEEAFIFKHTSWKSWAVIQIPGTPPPLQNKKHKQAVSIINSTVSVDAVFSQNPVICIYCPTTLFPIPMSPACEKLALLVSQRAGEHNTFSFS